MKPHINTYDRTYLWRILYDHVYMQKIKGNNFVELIIANFLEETQPHVTPFLLSKASKVLSYKL